MRTMQELNDEIERRLRLLPLSKSRQWRFRKKVFGEVLRDWDIGPMEFRKMRAGDG